MLLLCVCPQGGPSPVSGLMGGPSPVSGPVGGPPPQKKKIRKKCFWQKKIGIFFSNFFSPRGGSSTPPAVTQEDFLVHTKFASCIYETRIFTNQVYYRTTMGVVAVGRTDMENPHCKEPGLHCNGMGSQWSPPVWLGVAGP